jgi:carboxymethylenebutenolidase
MAGLSASVGCAEAAPPAPARSAADAPERAWSNVELDRTDVTFPSGPNTLRGSLAKPRAGGPFPTLIWNHGSEENPEFPRRMAKFWISHGWAFFVPYRRGHGGSGGTYFQVERSRADPSDRDAWDVAELERQADDVAAAVAFLRTQPFIDPQRIVVAGGSFGGIETVLVAERDLGLRAGLDFAGAAMSWSHNPALRERMRLAVRRARIPLFFIQAENDYNTEPTRELSQEAQRSGRPFRAKVYPPNGSTHQQGHTLCISRPDVWGGDVLAFLEPLVR